MFLQKYKMTEKPKGKLKDKINIAVDSIIQMSLGAPAITCLPEQVCSISYALVGNICQPAGTEDPDQQESTVVAQTRWDSRVQVFEKGRRPAQLRHTCFHQLWRAPLTERQKCRR